MTGDQKSDNLSNMKTVTVRDAQRMFADLLAEVERGETLEITRRGKVVARISPPFLPQDQWPDFEARQNALFPDGPPPGPPVSQLIIDAREDRF